MAQMVIAYGLLLLASFTLAEERPTPEFVEDGFVIRYELARCPTDNPVKWCLEPRLVPAWPIPINSTLPEEPSETWLEFIERTKKSSWLDD